MEHINSAITLPQSVFRKLVNSDGKLRELLPARQCKIIFWLSCIARLRFKFWSCKISRFKLKPFVHSGVDKRIKVENYITLIERVILNIYWLYWIWQCTHWSKKLSVQLTLSGSAVHLLWTAWQLAQTSSFISLFTGYVSYPFVFGNLICVGWVMLPYFGATGVVKPTSKPAAHGYQD